jgi:hypothetical protein
MKIEMQQIGARKVGRNHFIHFIVYPEVFSMHSLPTLLPMLIQYTFASER